MLIYIYICAEIYIYIYIHKYDIIRCTQTSYKELASKQNQSSVRNQSTNVGEIRSETSNLRGTVDELIWKKPCVYPPWNEHSTWKWMVGRLVSFWVLAYFQGRLLSVSGSVTSQKFRYQFKTLFLVLLQKVQVNIILSHRKLWGTLCSNTWLVGYE